jgi:ATPase family associated with various cellular activities (AAA)
MVELARERSSMPPDIVNADARIPDLRILVLGDVNLDTLIVPFPRVDHSPGRTPMTWENDGHYLRIRRRGGAWLLCDIINSALKFGDQKLKNATAYSTTIPGLYEVTDERLNSSLETPYLESYAILDLFPKELNSHADKRPNEEKVYRIKEGVIGWIDNRSFLSGADQKQLRGHDDAEWRWMLKEKREEYLQESLLECLKSLDPKKLKSKPDIVVLHDRDGHFRRLRPDSIDKYVIGHFNERINMSSKPPWIVWQMYSPLAAGTLWEKIKEQPDLLNRTVAVVKVECLRQAGANLPDGISLEKESQNFLDSIKKVHSLAELANVRHMLVHFHRQGVLHYDRDARLTNSCYFCPGVKVDTDQRKLGNMAGYTSILVAAIVRGLTWRIAKKRIQKRIEDDADVRSGIVDGLKQGVVLDHLHHSNGYAEPDFYKHVASPEPYDKLFSAIENVTSPAKGKDWKSYRIGSLDLPKDTDLSKWSRIEGFIKSRHEEFSKNEKKWELHEVGELLACQIVRRGLEKVISPDPKENLDDARGVCTPGTPTGILHCPCEVHGKIKTIDHNEIDRLLSIRQIMDKYRAKKDWRHPLSIAVFGPPGSGKSFTIKQLLQDVDPEIAKRPLEYNVSQFTDVGDLKNAFHEAQDRVLANELPLVFFDEFDSTFGEPLGWLKYFLAPMQDGKFKAGERMYSIGKAIFVFAGGISHSFFEFYDKRKDDESFKRAKGPDFVSRLRGHLDIAGVNPSPQSKPSDGGEGATRNLTIDPVLMFRRAILLRSILESSLGEIINPRTAEARIDFRVIRAFLGVQEYKHGVRSMQAIIEMTRISNRRDFQRSSLPFKQQLNMHVDDREFLRLIADADPPWIDEFKASHGTMD